MVPKAIEEKWDVCWTGSCPLSKFQQLLFQRMELQQLGPVSSMQTRSCDGCALFRCAVVACRPWLVKCSPAAKRPGPVPEVDAELWKLHNLWRERQQGDGRQQGECRDSVSSFER